MAFAQQNGATLASSQGYALGLSAANNNGEEDDIAEFTTTSAAFTGLVDLNDQVAAVNFDQKFTGNFTLDSPATGRGELTSNVFNGVFYAVDGSTVLFLETDTNQIGTGIFVLQNSSAQAGLANRAMALPRPLMRGNRTRSKR